MGLLDGGQLFFVAFDDVVDCGFAQTGFFCYFAAAEALFA